MNDVDRNLEALVRSAALHPRAAAAKGRFLAAVGASRRRPWAALAASAVAVASVLAAVLRPPDADPPATPVRPEPAPREIAVPRVDGDSRLSLRLRLPSAGAKRRMLRLDAVSTLPERTVLTLDIHRDQEELAPDGSLRSRRVHVGGRHVQVKEGRFDAEELFPQPGPYRFSVTARAENHPPDLRPRIEALPCRDWTFVAAAWDEGLIGAVEPALRELDDQAEALRTLIAEYASATQAETGWAQTGPSLVRRAEAVVKAFATSPASRLLPVGADRLVATARNLAGDSSYFKWEEGAFQGPVTYYDGQRMKTFRGDPWTFEALGSAVAEARHIGQREAGLWVLRELGREGRREPALSAAKALSAWPLLAVLVPLLDGASPAEVESALRRPPPK